MIVTKSTVPVGTAALPRERLQAGAPEGVTAPTRHFTIGKEVWIEREDFEEVPPKGYKRLFRLSPWLCRKCSSAAVMM